MGGMDIENGYRQRGGSKAGVAVPVVRKREVRVATAHMPPSGGIGENGSRRGYLSAQSRMRGAAGTHATRLVEFWLKITNDWIFNLSAVLAYNMLVSTIPILLALLVISGFFIGSVSPQTAAALQRSLAHSLPAGIGPVEVKAVADSMKRSAPLILWLSVLTSIFLGSRLFIAMENCFGIIFRLRGRNLVRQNVMAVAMMVLYLILVPLLFLASIAPAALLRLLDVNGHSGFGGFLLQVAGLLVAWLIALMLFGAIYMVVPNRNVRWQEVWHGAVAAASLLMLYEALFPFYVSLLLHPDNYGTIVGLLLVTLLFFFYLSFILLLGAEVTSWALGQRRTLGDLATLIHEVQAHNSTCDAAGPTAGRPSEDLKHHLGAEAKATREAGFRHERVDHRDDGRPPKRFLTAHSSLERENGCGDGAGS